MYHNPGGGFAISSPDMSPYLAMLGSEVQGAEEEGGQLALVGSQLLLLHV